MGRTVYPAESAERRGDGSTRSGPGGPSLAHHDSFFGGAPPLVFTYQHHHVLLVILSEAERSPPRLVEPLIRQNLLNAGEMVRRARRVLTMTVFLEGNGPQSLI